MSSGARDVPHLEGNAAGIVVKGYLDAKVAGTLGTGQSLGVQRPGLCRADAQGVRDQALAQQHVVAQLPGPLDRVRSQRPRSFTLAGEVVHITKLLA